MAEGSVAAPASLQSIRRGATFRVLQPQLFALFAYALTPRSSYFRFLHSEMSNLPDSRIYRDIQTLETCVQTVATLEFDRKRDTVEFANAFVKKNFYAISHFL